MSDLKKITVPDLNSLTSQYSYIKRLRNHIGSGNRYHTFHLNFKTMTDQYEFVFGEHGFHTTGVFILQDRTIGDRELGDDELTFELMYEDDVLDELWEDHNNKELNCHKQVMIVCIESGMSLYVDWIYLVPEMSNYFYKNVDNNIIEDLETKTLLTVKTNPCKEIPLPDDAERRGYVNMHDDEIPPWRRNTSDGYYGHENNPYAVRDTNKWSIKSDNANANAIGIAAIEKSLTDLKNKEEEKKMAKSSKIEKIKDANIAAAKQAAKLEVGTAATNIVVGKLKKQLPPVVGMYADHPLFGIAVANATATAITHFAPNSEKGNLLADAMIQAAMYEMVKNFNVAKLIEELVNGVDVSALTDGNE